MALKGDMLLRSLKVSQTTLTRYQRSILCFETWCKQQPKYFQQKSLDQRVNRFLHEIFQEGAEITEGTYLVYGLQMLKCSVPKDHFLVESKQSLSGWRKQCPGDMRIPVPEEFIYDFAFHALDLGRPDIAMLMMVQYDGFLRPSEAVGLTVEHVVKPQGKRYPHWGLIIAPSTLKQMTKTGKTDDSILLGDQRHNQWLKECLRLWMNGVVAEVFPDITLASLERFCKTASSQLGYQTVCLLPHVVRHSAASNSFYHKRRQLPEIMKRGRWTAKSSVARYEKAALLLRQWKHVSPKRKSLVLRRTQDFKTRFLQILRAGGGRATKK